jgi:UDP-N-acetylglucosamine:LPS N-acetylglucosamine transferase
MMTTIDPGKKILAVASGGGHWVQLLRLHPAFAGHHTEYVCTDESYQVDVPSTMHVVTDANLKQKAKLLRMFMEVAWIVTKFRPDIVITTGAAPGFAAILFGRLFGAKTVWLDSIANSEELSKSGKHARRWATVWLTQWEHLSDDNGPTYWGEVL